MAVHEVVEEVLRRYMAIHERGSRTVRIGLPVAAVQECWRRRRLDYFRHFSSLQLPALV